MWVLSNTSYDLLKYEYVIPKSTLKYYLEKVCPPLQCINAARPSNVEVRRGVEIKSVRNHQDYCSKTKIGRRTYLNSDEEALVVALEDI